MHHVILADAKGRKLDELNDLEKLSFFFQCVASIFFLYKFGYAKKIQWSNLRYLKGRVRGLRVDKAAVGVNEACSYFEELLSIVSFKNSGRSHGKFFTLYREFWKDIFRLGGITKILTDLINYSLRYKSFIPAYASLIGEEKGLLILALPDEIASDMYSYFDTFHAAVKYLTSEEFVKRIKGTSLDTEPTYTTLIHHYFNRGRFAQVLARKWDGGFETLLIKAWSSFYLGDYYKAEKFILQAQPFDYFLRIKRLRLLVRIWGRLGKIKEIKKVKDELENIESSLEKDILFAEIMWELDAKEPFLRKEEELWQRESRDVNAIFEVSKLHILAGITKRDPKYIEDGFRRVFPFRRSLNNVVEIASLWNDLAIARVWKGDLEGARRAILHAVSLLKRCDGMRVYTLAIRNLAEIELRMGKLDRVFELLTRVIDFNNKQNNFLAVAQDNVLLAKWYFLMGETKEAINLLHKLLKVKKADILKNEIYLHLARFYGLLGDRSNSSFYLEKINVSILSELEPEEIPALYSLAGKKRNIPFGELTGKVELIWRRTLAGFDSSSLVRKLDIHDFRKYRLVFDIFFTNRNSVKPDLVEEAISFFEKSGMPFFANRLRKRLAVGISVIEEILSKERMSVEKALEYIRSLYEGKFFLKLKTPYRILEIGEKVLEPEVKIETTLRNGTEVLFEYERDFSLAKILSYSIAKVLEVEENFSTSKGKVWFKKFGIVGSSTAIVNALKHVPTIAKADFPVLIIGETGTGKELIANAVYLLSRRKEKIYMVVNCATFTEDLVISELFGHRRGSFTGAVEDRRGVFESADGGTVFLDEIGDIPLKAQVALLRVLQNGELRRVGDSVIRKVDVRIIAATNKDLYSLVQEGKFREDLYYRIKCAVVKVPPLRARGDDVVEIARHFSFKDGYSLTKKAEKKLLTYNWPGNIRELKMVIDLAKSLAYSRGSKFIKPEDIVIDDGSEERRGNLHEIVDQFRRRVIRKYIENSSSVSQAAKKLGISRQALFYLIKKYSI